LSVSNPLAEPGGGRVAPPAVAVVFGASGDLTTRKLIPAFERLAARHVLHGRFSLVGVGRTEMSDSDFIRLVLKGVEVGGTERTPEWESFASGFRYVSGGYTDAGTFQRLRQVLDELDAERGTSGNRLFYLSTPPVTFPGIVGALAEHGLSRPGRQDAFVRIVIEKPYGHDERSASELDASVHAAFDENQVYRIDHYLGKETVQNLLALRFANAIFEPIWNRRYVDHVQVTVAEQLGIGHRGGFYETAGALRDIVQNHVMQVLALTLMEPPASFDAESIRDEKVKVLRAIKVPEIADVATEVVRAQYVRGWSQGVEARGYREEADVDPHSQTETYVAMRLRVENWRWASVPVYVRTGKHLPKRVTEVALVFRRPPHLPFEGSQARDLAPNALVLRAQPDEGITLRFGAKVPGQSFDVRSVSMDFFYGAAFLEQTPEAYERLLLDALIGDPTLFIRTDEVRFAWHIVDPILTAWEEDRAPLVSYVAGTWGPKEADDLLAGDGRQWRKP
jgi:glucose-6-phosphate 1-dehydrogenase